MTTLPTLPHIPRLLDLRALLSKKSHFLLGPRQTGKTTLVRDALPDATVYDLLDSRTYVMLSQHPERIGEELRSSSLGVVVIDEIQRIPELLNEVHRLIELRKIRFLLTGSSARKLRAGGVNRGRDPECARIQPIPPCGRVVQRDDRELHQCRQ